MFACATVLLGAACSPTLTSQGGTDVANPVVSGKLVNVDGAPAANTLVLLIPSHYEPAPGSDPLDFRSDTTDQDGNYTITSAQPGVFNIQSVNLDKHTRSLATDVPLFQRKVQVPYDTLRRPGAIKVEIPSNADTTNGYLFILGTTIVARVTDTMGFVLFDSVPANKHLQLYYGTTVGGAAPRLIRDSIVVSPAETTTVAYPNWSYSRKIVFNTGASGAAISDNVADFPVLVRLTSSNFTFPEAKSNGADLLFTKPDGTVLKYEIGRWDAMSQAAEIWVKIDTVYGNNDTQFVTMYWGNTNALSSSNGASVFDTALGFAGVWHMEDPTGDISDATQNGLTGTNDGTQTCPGLMGDGRAFNMSRISMGGSSELSTLTDSITESLWIKSTQKTRFGCFRHQACAWFYRVAIRLHARMDELLDCGVDRLLHCQLSLVVRQFR